MANIVVDSGVLYALFDHSEKGHGQAGQGAQGFDPLLLAIVTNLDYVLQNVLRTGSPPS